MKTNLLQLKLLFLLLLLLLLLSVVVAVAPVCLRCLSAAAAAVTMFHAESLANPQPHINQSLINLSPQTRKIKKKTTNKHKHKRKEGMVAQQQNYATPTQGTAIYQHISVHKHLGMQVHICIYVCVKTITMTCTNIQTNKYTQTQTPTNVYLLNNNALQWLLEKAWQSAVFDEFSA